METRIWNKEKQTEQHYIAGALETYGKNINRNEKTCFIALWRLGLEQARMEFCQPKPSYNINNTVRNWGTETYADSSE